MNVVYTDNDVVCFLLLNSVLLICKICIRKFVENYKIMLKGGRNIYKYVFVKANVGNEEENNYQKIVEDYTNKGFRFISIIPFKYGEFGKLKEIDLIFEKDTTK